MQSLSDLADAEAGFARDDLSVRVVDDRCAKSLNLVGSSQPVSSLDDRQRMVEAAYDAAPGAQVRCTLARVEVEHQCIQAPTEPRLHDVR